MCRNDIIKAHFEVHVLLRVLANSLISLQMLSPWKQQFQSTSNQIKFTLFFRLKQIQEQMIQGGRKAGDKDLKEKRKLKKKAAENRLKVLGEALGHVDDEDGVLVQVYDDIQEELRVKTEALKKSKLKVKILIELIRKFESQF